MAEYNGRQLLRTIEAAVRSEDDTADVMASVIDYCADAIPNPQWKRFRRFDWARGARLDARWLARALEREPVPPGLDGLWLGLFNPVTSRGEVIAGMYVAAARFDAAAVDCFVNPPYFPQGRYARSRVLSDIYRAAYSGRRPLENDAEYPLCLAYAGLVLRDAALAHGETLLGAARTRTLVVGFDSGDTVVVGVLTPRGLRSRRLPRLRTH